MFFNHRQNQTDKTEAAKNAQRAAEHINPSKVFDDVSDLKRKLEQAQEKAQYYREKYDALMNEYWTLARNHDRVTAKNKRRKKALRDMNKGMILKEKKVIDQLYREKIEQDPRSRQYDIHDAVKYMMATAPSVLGTRWDRKVTTGVAVETIAKDALVKVNETPLGRVIRERQAQDKPHAAIAEWEVVEVPKGEYGFTLHLQGVVMGHPKLQAGSYVRTSPLLSLDRDARVAVTQNTVYHLKGDPVGKVYTL